MQIEVREDKAQREPRERLSEWLFYPYAASISTLLDLLTFDKYNIRKNATVLGSLTFFMEELVAFPEFP